MFILKLTYIVVISGHVICVALPLAFSHHVFAGAHGGCCPQKSITVWLTLWSDDDSQMSNHKPGKLQVFIC